MQNCLTIIEYNVNKVYTVGKFMLELYRLIIVGIIILLFWYIFLGIVEL